MKTLLLTGFGLWGNESYNSSWEILAGNPLALPPVWQVRTEQLPVSWTDAPARLDALLEDPSIRAVICLGMCGGRAMRIERLAINLNDPDREDSGGRKAPGEYVVPGGPPAYWSGFPVSTLVQALNAARVPAVESRSAGGFLCNFVFYHLLHRLAARTPVTVGGFVHVPHYETEGGLPAELLRLSVPVIAAAVAHAADAPELPLV
jgi:pyroglutamyl-peptidase